MEVNLYYPQTIVNVFIEYTCGETGNTGLMFRECTCQFWLMDRREGLTCCEYRCSPVSVCWSTYVGFSKARHITMNIRPILNAKFFLIHKKFAPNSIDLDISDLWIRLSMPRVQLNHRGDVTDMFNLAGSTYHWCYSWHGFVNSKYIFLTISSHVARRISLLDMMFMECQLESDIVFFHQTTSLSGIRPDHILGLTLKETVQQQSINA